MLLPQSAAFAALKNRLNSVSAIGYLHIPGPAGPGRPTSSSLADLRPQGGASAVLTGFERANKLKAREEPGGGGAHGGGPVKWSELLEKFRLAQDKARRASRTQMSVEDGEAEAGNRAFEHGDGKVKAARQGVEGRVGAGSGAVPAMPNKELLSRSKFGAVGLSRLTSGARAKPKR